MTKAPPVTPRAQFLSLTFLTTEQLCLELGVCRLTVLRWRELGMPYMASGRVYRYNLHEVAQWLGDRAHGHTHANKAA